MEKIIINNLSKYFGEKRGFDEISFEIELCNITVIMAPSGYGKTTLLKCIAGLLKPSSGDMINVPEKISFVFQDDRLLEDFSVVSNIKFVTKKYDEKRALDILSKLDLKDLQSTPVKQLSGGMKRRVAIARALCADYDLLILDEPLKGLDNELRDRTIDFIKEYNKEKTVIVVTHDIYEAEKFGGEIIQLDLLKSK
ncbi:MAG: ATP-binding cassette domain-containing protein [Clostridia bacterium]|nr:ATP-binding cassette domain-containing protein [Clostridia bacterium]